MGMMGLGVHGVSSPKVLRMGQSAARPWPGHAVMSVARPSRIFSNSAMRLSTSASLACAECFTRATSRRAESVSNSLTSFSEKPSACARRMKRSRVSELGVAAIAGGQAGLGGE